MLTDAAVLALIDQGETYTTEFKGEEREPLSDSVLVENVVCLANGRGGVLLVGVEDDGRVTGARPRHGVQTDARRVEAVVANKTVPSVPVECSVAHARGCEVLVVEVPALQQPASTSGGLFKRRALDHQGRPACVPLHFHEMQGAQAARGAQDYSALPLVEARWDDLDPLEFERLRQMIARNPGRADRALLGLSDADLVRSLGLGAGGDGTDRANALTVAALLLLGREASIHRLIPTHEAAFQVLDGTRIVVNSPFYRRPLLWLAEEFASRFDARNEEREVAIGFVSVGIPDYSPAGFREALHNALIHRDYTERGAVHIQWRLGEIEIANPGGFVEGVSLANLLVTAPRARNPVLADAFKRIGLVERTGRGIDTIYEGQLRFGRPAPDYSRSHAHGVQVVLHGGPANLDLARWFIERETPGHPVSVEEMLLVNAAERERQLDVEHAAVLLQRDAGTARALLERLVEQGVFESRGTLRRRHYGLSAAAYRALGAPAAHTRVQDFEPFRQEQMVLQYVEAHGRITRREAAGLCQIDSRDASNLLRRLAQSGRLRLRGEKRGSHYVSPPAS